MRRALVLAATAACYQPSLHSGAPCASDGSCPPPLHCSARNTCELADDDASGPHDAPIDTAVTSHDGAPDAPGMPIVWKATTTQVIPVAAGQLFVTIDVPPSSAGDVMVATIAMGNTGQTAAPAFTAPTGWTVVDQTNKGLDSALATYWHVASDTEPATVTWTFNEVMEGVAWISAYANVSTTAPIDAHKQLLVNNVGPAYTAPSVTTSTAGAMLVLTYAVHGSTAPTWLMPSGTTMRATLDNGTTRRGVGVERLLVATGSTPSETLTATVEQDYALLDVTALAPR